MLLAFNPNSTQRDALVRTPGVVGCKNSIASRRSGSKMLGGDRGAYQQTLPKDAPMKNDQHLMLHQAASFMKS